MAESFFQRWSRRKVEHSNDVSSTTPGITESASACPPRDAPPADTPLTLEDVERHDQSSDFSVFMREGVDKDVRRAALKKMFADPHFNVPDGLDIHMEDYNKFVPLGAGMLAALNHARSVLDPQPLWRNAKAAIDAVTGERREEETQGAAAEQDHEPETEAGQGRTDEERTPPLVRSPGTEYADQDFCGSHTGAPAANHGLTKDDDDDQVQNLQLQQDHASEQRIRPAAGGPAGN